MKSLFLKFDSLQDIFITVILVSGLTLITVILVGSLIFIINNLLLDLRLYVYNLFIPILEQIDKIEDDDTVEMIEKKLLSAQKAANLTIHSFKNLSLLSLLLIIWDLFSLFITVLKKIFKIFCYLLIGFIALSCLIIFVRFLLDDLIPRIFSLSSRIYLLFVQSNLNIFSFVEVFVMILAIIGLYFICLDFKSNFLSVVKNKVLIKKK